MEVAGGNLKGSKQTTTQLFFIFVTFYVGSRFITFEISALKSNRVKQKHRTTHFKLLNFAQLADT